jgi:hypothetical protein
MLKAGGVDAGDRRVGHKRQALARAIVDHDEDAQAAAIDELVGSEDQRSFGHCGTSTGARVPKARLRPPRRRTKRRSSR